MRIQVEELLLWLNEFAGDNWVEMEPTGLIIRNGPGDRDHSIAFSPDEEVHYHDNDLGGGLNTRTACHQGPMCIRKIAEDQTREAEGGDD